MYTVLYRHNDSQHTLKFESASAIITRDFVDMIDASESFSIRQYDLPNTRGGVTTNAR